MNPTNDVLEKRMAALEGGAAALAFASGQAAITAAILTITRAGQNIVSSTSLYGGTWTLFSQTFKKIGIEVRFFNPDHPGEIHKLVDANTRLVYLESIGNPRNDVPDFQAIADIAHSHELPVNEPDPSYHGVVFAEALKPIGNISYIIYMRTHWLRDTGAAMSPFAAFLFLLGIETLNLRMERHTSNTQAFAEWLTKHPLVEWVNYPGLPGHPHHANAKRYIPGGPGAVVGFGIKGGREAGVRLIDNLKLASHLANLGDAKTLVIHPASTTHQQLTEEEQAATGVQPEYIRVCVGIEDIADICEDFDQALRASQ
jgi:O-acetylhomoserine (thiol)-lyase